MAYSLRSIAKGSFVYASGHGLIGLANFLLIPVYTRFLAPDEYGIVGYMQFLLQVLSAVFTLGLQNAQTRFYYEHKDDPQTIGQFLFTINLCLAAVLIPAVLFIIHPGEALHEMIGPERIPFHPYVPLVAGAMALSIMNQLTISFWIIRKEYVKATALQLSLFAILTAFAILLVVVWERGAEGKVQSLLYGNAAFFVLTYYFYARNFRLKPQWSYMAYSLAYGLPLVAHRLADVLHTSVDRAILADRVSVAELGIYTLGYQVGMVMHILTNAINIAWQPSYLDLMESDAPSKDYHVRRTYTLWVTVMALFCTAGILWGGDILALVTPEHYHRAGVIIPFILLGYFFHGLFLFACYPIFFHKQTKLLPWITGGAVAINIALNYALIPAFGITGAAAATTLSMFMLASLAHLAANRLHRHGLPMACVLLVAALMAALGPAPFLIEDLLLSHLARVASFALIAAVLAYLFRPDVRKLATLLRGNPE